MRHFYVPFLLLFLSATLLQAQDSEPLFPQLENVLYQDATHAYDDATVIMLGKRHTSLLQSRLIPVRQGDVISFETYVHYTRSKTKTWQKVGAAAAGLAIGSLPYMLNRGQSAEGGSNNNWLKTAALLAGAGVAALPFVLDKRRGKSVSRSLSTPKVKNGLFVPNAYLRYKLYDQKGYLVKTETQSIDKQAKDAWQRLSLRKEITQDGYLLVELGNESKRSVWMDGAHIAYHNSAKAPMNYKNSRTENSLLGEKGGATPVDTVGTSNSSGPTKIPTNTGGDGGGNGGGGTGNRGIERGSGTADDPYVMSEAVVTAPPTAPDHLNTSKVSENLYYHEGSSNYVSGYYSSSGTGESNPTPGSGNNPDSHPSDIDDDSNGVPHPGQKNWGDMSNNEKAAHILKAIKYAKQQGIAVNLNHYFTNLPRTGNYGLGGFHEVKGNVIINGTTVPITIIVPILPDQRVFHVDYLAASNTFVGADYGATYLYGYGLNGSNINLLSIYIPVDYDDLLEEVLGE